jgi:ATP synthase protein I
MTEPEEDPFVKAVRQQAERTRRSRSVTFWRGLGEVGSVGWMVALPAVAGALLGRKLDASLGTGIFWTLSLLFLGVGLGGAAAWRHVKRELDL